MVPDILEENFWADTPQMNREVPCAGRCKKERILFVSFFCAQRKEGRKEHRQKALEHTCSNAKRKKQRRKTNGKRRMGKCK